MFQATGASHLTADDELYPDNINRLWHRFEHVLQEHEMATQQEIIRYALALRICSVVLYRMTRVAKLILVPR